MAKIKTIFKKSNIKMRAVSILLVITVLGGSFMWFGDNKMETVHADVDKQYMEYIVDRIVSGIQDKMYILEIVPHTGQGEFRYYLGDDKVEKGLEANQELLKTWYGNFGNYIANGQWTNADKWYSFDGIGILSNFAYKMRYNSYSDLFEIECEEIFYENVIPDYAGILDGKVHLDTVEANDLTKEVIERADLIIVSTGTHDNKTMEIYNAYSGDTTTPFYGDSTGSATTSSDYDTYEKVTADDGTVSYVSRDASWEMVDVLLDYVIYGRDLELSDGTVVENLKTPVVLDNKEAGYLDKDGNMYKFGLIYRMLAEDRYEDIEDYFSTTYTAADGTTAQYINSKGIVTAALDTTATGTFTADTVTSWGAGSNPVNNPIAKFFETVGNAGYSDYYDPNPFSPEYLTNNYWIYSGDSVLIPKNVGVTSDVSGKPGFSNRVGATASSEGILQYLLGAKPSQIKTFDYTMRVLEVQPSNSFDYDTYEEALALGKRMLMSGTASWNEGNYKQYLDIDCVTTNALNGMTDDLISEYDMIIIGENTDLLTKDANGKTIYNDVKLNGYVYLAFGDLMKIGSSYLGYLPDDYVKLTSGTSGLTTMAESTKYLFTDYIYNKLKSGNTYVLKNMYEYYKSNGAYGATHYDSAQGQFYRSYSLGNVRLADNDITDITKEKLIKFAEAGKIIVLGDSLYNLDGSKVYPTSDMYEFIKKMATVNESGGRRYSVLRQKRVGGAYLYFNNIVPEITMTKIPKEPTYSSGVISSFGSRDLEYRFQITGQPGATYKIKLYIDKNSDGVYKGLEAGISDDSNELCFTDKITLNGGNTADYCIESKLSDDFVGMLSWKIEVVQLDASGKETPYMTSEKGYSAIQNDTMQNIRVLQIMPDNVVTLDMSMTYTANPYDFQDLLEAIEEPVGHNIIIDTMTASEYESLFVPSGDTDNRYTKGVDINTEKDRLLEYDMIVIGFADMYGSDDISNIYGAFDNIMDFMEIGKAVLFTHDTLSWRSSVNYATSDVAGSAYKSLWDTYKMDIYGKQLGNNAEDFAFQLTRNLRNAVGMDKYGITLKEADRDGKEKPVYSSSLAAPTYQSASGDGQYHVSELQGFTPWCIYRGSFIKTFTAGYQSWVGMDAYSLMPYTQNDYFADDLWTTTQVTQLNEGAITMYPYNIDEDLEVATTHAQYYELDMEDEDIVVWYTLSGDENRESGYYECTEKDAGNNYYIYSKNNITYSGAGHSNMDSVMELKLFVNTIVKAIAGGNNIPVVTVTNGAIGTGGIYMIYTNTADSAKDYQLDIKATDADLISYESAGGNLDLVGEFKEANIYWVKPDGTEVLIKSYTESNPLKNGVIRELSLKDTSLTAAQLSTIETLVEDSGDASFAEFRIEVYDWVGAKDEITVHLVKRDLFELE